MFLCRAEPGAGRGTAELTGSAAGGGTAVIINRAFDRLRSAENGGAAAPVEYARGVDIEVLILCAIDLVDVAITNRLANVRFQTVRAGGQLFTEEILQVRMSSQNGVGRDFAASCLVVEAGIQIKLLRAQRIRRARGGGRWCNFWLFCCLGFGRRSI